MKVAIFVHDSEGDMGDATIIGPFRDWNAAENFRDRNYPDDGPLEAIVVPMVGQRDTQDHPVNERGGE